MKVTKELKTNKGITLIALIITIIVMLILVGVTISMAVNGGLFNYAGKAVGETKNAINAEQDLANGGITIDGTYYSSINEYLNKDKERISKTENYIGYYADIDGDGTVDGVIYADLAFEKEGIYYDRYTYSYEPVTGLKDYYISKTNYEGIFGTKDVLAPIGNGNDRFYVMALTDVTTEDFTTFYWYYNSDAHGNFNEFEGGGATDFGEGKANTLKMKQYWDAETPYGEQNERDIWAQIDINSKWFVPSFGEWMAFASALNINYDWESDTCFETLGLGLYYWTSTEGAIHMDFFEDLCIYEPTFEGINLRLSATF